METVRHGKIKSLLILAVLIALFVGIFAVYGPWMCSDSEQYINMHIHREPLYPLFLWVLRLLFGEGFLTAMGILQGILAAVGIWAFAEYVTKKFRLFFWEELVILVLLLFPYAVTRFFSQTRLFIPNSVMSEGLSMPFFLLFLTQCFEMFTQEKKREFLKAAGASLLLAFLLALARSQMMSLLLVWLVVFGAKIIYTKAWRKKFLRLAAAAGIVLLVFVLRGLFVKSYNLAFHGRFISNTNGTVHMLTNILYAADEEDGENIQDEEARAFFYQMYHLTETNQANYKFAGDSLTEKLNHLEEWHNTINFEMIEAVLRLSYRENVTEDYIEQDLLSDETAGRIIAGILPGCFPKWFANYMLMVGFGLIRSIAVSHPLINWIAIAIYLFSALLAVISVRQRLRRGEKTGAEVWFLLLVLLAIFANAFTVAMVIMPISRYMIYGFAPFYTAGFVLLISLYRDWQEKRMEKGQKTWAIKI